MGCPRGTFVERGKGDGPCGLTGGTGGSSLFELLRRDLKNDRADDLADECEDRREGGDKERWEDDGPATGSCAEAIENSEDVVVRLSLLSPDVPVDLDCMRESPAAVEAESVVGISGRFGSLRADFELNSFEAFFFNLPARPVPDWLEESNGGRPGYVPFSGFAFFDDRALRVSLRGRSGPL